MSSFYLRQHEEWLCCRRLGEESVMRKLRFFWGGGGPPRSGSTSPLSTNQAWRDLSLPPLQVNSTRTDLWKCLTFSGKTAPGSLFSLKPNQPKRSIFLSLFLLLLSSLSQPVLTVSLHSGRYHTFVLASKNWGIRDDKSFFSAGIAGGIFFIDDVDSFMLCSRKVMLPYSAFSPRQALSLNAYPWFWIWTVCLCC